MARTKKTYGAHAHRLSGTSSLACDHGDHEAERREAFHTTHTHTHTRTRTCTPCSTCAPPPCLAPPPPAPAPSRAPLCASATTLPAPHHGRPRARPLALRATCAHRPPPLPPRAPVQVWRSGVPVRVRVRVRVPVPVWVRCGAWRRARRLSLKTTPTSPTTPMHGMHARALCRAGQGVAPVRSMWAAGGCALTGSVRGSDMAYTLQWHSPLASLPAARGAPLHTLAS